MELESNIRRFKDRLRIFFILYFFADDFSDPAQPKFKKLFKSEIRIQKIDFLIRNPDYLAYELLNVAKTDAVKKIEIKNTITAIFNSKEPSIRRLEMERFFFGAYEDIDDVISFLKSIDFIDFSSKKSSDFRTIEKQYFITDLAVSKFENTMPTLNALKWYMDRCELIKKYFGDLTGTQLKIAQYQIKEYRNTTYNNYIGSIQGIVEEEFYNFYGERL